MFVSSAQRRATRSRRASERLARLAEVDVVPATTRLGRVVTVVVRPPQAATEPDARPFDLASYIRPWRSTLLKLGLRGTVLHSGFSYNELVQVASGSIATVAVDPGPRHVFHERHRLVRAYLQSIEDPYVFVTDASDVAFKRDPFELVRAAGARRMLCIGREKHRILFCRCVRREMLRQFGRIWYPWRPVLNPGILGGRREVVLEALDHIIALTDAQGERLVCSDMCLVNRAIHAAFAPHELCTGFPLHSRFKGWEFDTAAAILHK